jgi:hypothetical protein
MSCNTYSALKSSGVAAGSARRAVSPSDWITNLVAVEITSVFFLLLLAHDGIKLPGGPGSEPGRVNRNCVKTGA